MCTGNTAYQLLYHMQNKSLPNFLIIGAAKSGTTALYHYLNQHSEVFLTPIKETNFFSMEGKIINFSGPGDKYGTHRTSINKIEDYYQQFTKVKNEKAIGEVCPSYLYYKEGPINIHKYIPDVKIILILRNPVDRAFSAYSHMIRDGREFLSFEEAMKEESNRIDDNWAEIWHYKEESKYYDQLKRYYEFFPKENIKIFLYKDFQENPHIVYSEICDFIGVSTGFKPDYSALFNQGGVPKLLWLHKLMNKPNVIKTLFNFIIPYRFRVILKDKLQRRILKPSSKLSAEDKIKYYKLFQEDVKKLEELINIKLDRWRY
jgi:hypothetical protein